MQQDFIQIGIIGKPHGTSGAFHFKLTAQLLDEVDLPDVLFIKLREGILPYFIEEVHLKNEYQGNISFEDITSREQGAALVNAELMIKASDYEKYFEQDEEDYLLGYTVIDATFGIIGQIVEVIDNTVQEVAVVQHGDKQILFPLVDDFILDENETEKTIKVQLPEGLIDTYLNQTEEENDAD